MESRSYRFISDPDHKENLSGRVRAACLNCRRKKIRCTGEVPCQTCKEKAVLCEGLTDRKRPIKNSERHRSLDASSESSNVEALASPRKKSAPDTSRPRAPGTNLSKRPEVVRVDTFGSSSDSSVSSGQHSRLSEWQDNVDPHQQSVSSQTGLYANQAVNILPFNNPWNLNTGLNMASYAASDIMSNNHAFSDPLSEKSPAWQEQERVDSVSWPPNNYRNRDASELISTAKMLEAQAQSLRLLASEQHAQHFNDSRRQTVTLPLQSDVYSDFSSTPLHPKGAFDDMDRIASTNSAFPPPVCDCNSWLDGGCTHWKQLPDS